MALKKPRSPASILAAIPPLSQVLRGSLLERQTFHAEGCSKCAEGIGHTQWVINVNYPGGQTRQVTVSPAQVPAVRQWIANYRQIKESLEAISEINLAAVRAAREAAKSSPAEAHPAGRRKA